MTSTGRIRLSGFAAAALTLLMMPAAAGAGNATSDGSRVTFEGSAGENSDLLIRETEDSEGRPIIRLLDQNQNSMSTSTPDRCETDDNVVDCIGASSIVVNLNDGDDRAVGSAINEQINGGSGNDTLFGGTGDDVVDGGAGDDMLEGSFVVDGTPQPQYRAGADTMIGGPGDDLASYYGNNAPVTASIDGVANDGAGEGDNISGDIEGIEGGFGNDNLSGGPGPDRLRGYAGNDTIQARDGQRDAVDCGLDNDTVAADAVDGVVNCENVQRGGGGTPGTIPGPTSDVLAPTLDAALPRRLKLGTALKKGLPVTASCDEACALAGIAEVSGRDARGVKVVIARTVVVAKGGGSLAGAGQRKVVLRFTSRAKRRLKRRKRVTLRVTVAAEDSAGNRTAVAGRFTLKR